jgi:hypothetical protein
VPDGRYVAVTGEGRRVTLIVRRRAVVRVRTSVRRYRCDVFGDIGPAHVDERGRAPIGPAGAFRIAWGDPAQRLTIHGTMDRRGRARGRLRVRGTIATGQRCASVALRFAPR